MASRKRPASRGFVNNIILESLLSGDKYGYEIIKEVEDKSNGKITALSHADQYTKNILGFSTRQLCYQSLVRQ